MDVREGLYQRRVWVREGNRLGSLHIPSVFDILALAGLGFSENSPTTEFVGK